MKYILCFLILFPLSFFSQKKNDKVHSFGFSIFSKTSYDKVICYECDPNKQGFILMNQTEVVNSKIIINSKEMTAAQVDSLQSKFTYKLIPTQEKHTKDFYYQDVAFVYYFKNIIVAYYCVPISGNIINLFFVQPNKERTVSYFRASFNEADRKQLNFICADLKLNCKW